MRHQTHVRQLFKKKSKFGKRMDRLVGLAEPQDRKRENWQELTDRMATVLTDKGGSGSGSSVSSVPTLPNIQG